MAGQKTRQSVKRKSQRTLELEKKHTDTLAHLDALSQQEAQLHEQLGALGQAKQQMLGRLRLIEEDLGVSPPLTAPQPMNGATPEAAVDGAPEEAPEGE